MPRSRRPSVRRPRSKAPPASSPLPTGTVTFLFSDIEGSTRLVQQLGATRFQDILERHQRAFRSAFQAHGGVERGTEGDSFFVVFADAAAAVAAAVDAQRSLAAIEWPEEAIPRVRIGLHAGSAQLGGDDYVGLDVHRAARIAAAGHGGQVLVSDSVRALVGQALPAGVGLRDLGEHRLRDLPFPERLHQLVVDGLPDEFPPLRSMPARRGNIPVRLTSFVGRQRELGELAELLRDTRLVTLTGPGGTGKTSLACELAREHAAAYRDGAWFVRLEALSQPDLVAATMAATLGLQLNGPVPPDERVREHLSDRSTLLVLDNFEQVLAAAPIVSELLTSAPELKVVATSRSPLHLAAEREYPVEPLPLPDPSGNDDLAALEAVDTIRLFVERAQRAQPGFALTAGNAAAVAEICRRLDGLPLAIELAASRIRMFSPEALATRLTDRLGLLRGGAVDLPERHRTLRTTVDWSYRLLPEPCQLLLGRLSVFSGGWTLDAAETICNPAGELGLDTIDGLTTLIEGSLIRHGDRSDADRFGMLETIREYALERLAESGDEDAVRTRHAEYYRDLAAGAASHLVRPEHDAWSRRLGLEADNIRAALEWTVDKRRPDIGLPIGVALWRYWQQVGQLREGRAFMERLLAIDGASPRTRLEGLTAAGGIAYWLGDVGGAADYYQAAHAVAEEMGDRAAIAEALYNLAYTDLMRSELASAESRLLECRRLAAELANAHQVALADVALAILAIARGQYEAALERAEGALPGLRQAGDLFLLQFAISLMAQARRLVGDLKGAAALYRESLGVMTVAWDRPLTARRLLAVADLLIAAGRAEEGMRLWGAGLPIFEEIGVDLDAPLRMMNLADAVDRAREQIGAERAEAASAAGRALPTEDALAEMEKVLRDWPQ